MKCPQNQKNHSGRSENITQEKEPSVLLIFTNIILTCVKISQLLINFRVIVILKLPIFQNYRNTKFVGYIKIKPFTKFQTRVFLKTLFSLNCCLLSGKLLKVYIINSSSFIISGKSHAARNLSVLN